MTDDQKERLETFKKDLMALCGKYHFDIEARVKLIDPTRAVAVLEITDTKENDEKKANAVVN